MDTITPLGIDGIIITKRHHANSFDNYSQCSVNLRENLVFKSYQFLIIYSMKIIIQIEISLMKYSTGIYTCLSVGRVVISTAFIAS